MDKTKIDWCDSTWNPVTGCLHGCEYCYARKIASRFGKFCKIDQVNIKTVGSGQHTCVEVEYKQDTPYPEMFTPTLHKYRLNEPAQKTKPQNIFVCSMADLFGEWVPDSWIKEVFEACEAAPQHRYLFLTKNPERYNQVLETFHLPEEHHIIKQRSIENLWFGMSATGGEISPEWIGSPNKFISIEPLLSEVTYINFHPNNPVDWVIVGAETGSREGKVIPKKEWIDEIVNKCRVANIPVFMKSSLSKIWGEPLIQEYPWEE